MSSVECPLMQAGWKLRWFDLINLVYSKSKVFFGDIFSSYYCAHVFNILLLALTSFLFARRQGWGFYLSLFVSIATTFSTGLIVFLYIGHITKLISLPMLPVLLMLLFQFQKKITLLDFLILVVAMHMLVVGWHIQIIFYILFAIGIYFIYYVAKAIKEHNNHLRNQLFKSIGDFVFIRNNSRI